MQFAIVLSIWAPRMLAQWSGCYHRILKRLCLMHPWQIMHHVHYWHHTWMQLVTLTVTQMTVTVTQLQHRHQQPSADQDRCLHSLQQICPKHCYKVSHCWQILKAIIRTRVELNTGAISGTRTLLCGSHKPTKKCLYLSQILQLPFSGTVEAVADGGMVGQLDFTTQPAKVYLVGKHFCNGITSSWFLMLN